MKLAISGKGGVGKSTLAATFALLLAQQGWKVLALDADPDANLAAALGIPLAKQDEIIPISQQVRLIEKRTGARVKQYGQIFKLNPEVSDIAEGYAIKHDGVSLLVLGGVEQGGSGCACPENVFLRALVMDVVLYKEETLIMDMEAGIEHLGRTTVQGVDSMIIVVEPGQRSVDSAYKIIRMSREIGLRRIQLVGNKIGDTKDEHFILNKFPDFDFLGIIPFSEKIRQNDRDGKSVLDGLSEGIVDRFRKMLDILKKQHPTF
jgi:CO dehydrogenase maturation factor